MTTENKIKYFENREDWRKWLMDNFETSCEIWFVFPYKSSGKKGILDFSRFELTDWEITF